MSNISVASQTSAEEQEMDNMEQICPNCCSKIPNNEECLLLEKCLLKTNKDNIDINVINVINAINQDDNADDDDCDSGTGSVECSSVPLIPDCSSNPMISC
jgi:hypothetical protein